MEIEHSPDFQIRLTSDVIVYSTVVCPFCVRAKSMLELWAVSYQKMRIDTDDAAMDEYVRVTNGARTVPQIVVEGRLITG